MNGEWRFGEEGSPLKHSGVVPGTVHTDLMRLGLIPDPYFGTNEDSVQWVGERDWTYLKEFSLTAEQLEQEQVDLVFEGLDTFAELWLNDSLLGRTENMFRTWAFPVKGMLREGPNTLRVRFRSALAEGVERAKAYGRSLPADNDQGVVRVSPFVRKAGVHFGWDFAPRLITCGIWQNVGIRGWSKGRIESVRVRQGAKNGTRQLTFIADLHASERATGSLSVSINGRELAHSELQERTGWFDQALSVSIPDTGLWWPNGSGAQRLQRCAVTWSVNGKVRSRWVRDIGLRSIALDQGSDPVGTAFQFNVNGVPTFMKGANLVPPDMFLPRAGDSAWVQLVRHAQDANMNMLRVWGGGVYPPDAFFLACDTAGILVWQDLMFANTMVPDDDDFLTNVQAEVGDQIRRLQYHPCLALWCGNNEVNVAWHNWGWQKAYAISAADSVRMWNAYTALFEEALPHWVWLLAGANVYLPSSPVSNWGHAAGLDHGDLHYWGVWHGDEPLSALARNVGRFVSEYGFQSYPDLRTLQAFAPEGDLSYPSAFWAGRQKSYKGDKAIVAMAAQYGMRISDGRGLIAVGQELQARAYALAIDAHAARRPLCMGTLLWQLNDVWPGASWSIVDHSGRRKPAFTAVQKGYRAIVP